MILLKKNRYIIARKRYSNPASFSEQLSLLLKRIEKCETKTQSNNSSLKSRKNVNMSSRSGLYKKFSRYNRRGVKKSFYTDDICKKYSDGLDYFKLGIDTIDYDTELCGIFGNALSLTNQTKQKLIGIIKEKDKNQIIDELKELQTVKNSFDNVISKMGEVEALKNKDDKYAVLSGAFCECLFGSNKPILDSEMTWNNFKQGLFNTNKK